MMNRRHVLQLTTGAATSLAVAPQAAIAQSYPSRAIKLVSPYAAGGATDTVARLIGQWITERLDGASVIIENKPGGGANIGTESVIRAPADGHTLLLTSTANAVNPALFPKLNFNFLQDSAAVANVGTAFNILLVLPSSPVTTTAEFIAYVKANPGKVTVGLPGIGSPQHLSAELFKAMTATDPLFVQYRGGSTVLNDLLGGHVNAGFGSSIASVEFVKAGTLRALGVTAGSRSAAFADIPSLAEAIPGYESINFYGISAPKGTPPEIVQRLNGIINAGHADAKLKAQLATLGIDPAPMTPDGFAKLIASETEKWGKVVTSAGIKPN